MDRKFNEPDRSRQYPPAFYDLRRPGGACAG